MIQGREKLFQLAPWLRPYVFQVVDALAEIGINATVYSVYRSPADQNARYKAGESNAMGGQSPHQFGLAFDFVAREGENSEQQVQLQRFWAALGFAVLDRPVGNPPRRDLSHVEVPNWRAFVR